MLGRNLSHYRIVEQIGAGGMGVVFLAHDEQLERDVAIKVLPPGTLADETARKRFRQEALSLAKLNHPNIATIHDFDTDGQTDFLVTEYIAGESLDKKLAAGALPSKDVVRLGLQLAQGLAAAHARGIIHRDLKPANLRLTTDGRLKILDFGLAQFAHPEGDLSVTASLTSSQQITGTLPYMSPEQLRGEPSDRRTDIWAAGAVLYELSTGKRPFPETHGPMLINAILNQEPELPSRINPQISAGLESVIWKALRKNRADRYQSVGELEEDLERLTAGVLRCLESQALMVRLREVGRGRANADAGFSVEQELEKIPVIVGVVIADVILMRRRSGEQRDRNEGDRRAAVGDADETGRSHTNDRTEVVPDLKTSADDAGSSSVLRLPVLIPKYDHGRADRSPILGDTEQTSDDRTGREEIEETGAARGDG